MSQINALKKNLPEAGQDIPGLDLVSRAKVALANHATFGLGGKTVDAAVLDKDALLNRKNIQQLRLAYKKAITGTGASEKEAQDITDAFEGTRTTAELWDTINQLDKVVADRKANFDKGFGPEVVNSYNANGEASPKTATVDFKKGL